MADNFSQDQVQGIFGEFKPVIDTSVTPSQDNVQGVFGEFVPVLDEAAGVSAATPVAFIVFPQSHISLFSRAFIMLYPTIDLVQWRVSVTTAVAAGRIMGSLANAGGLAYRGGIAGKGGGLAS